MKKVIVTLATVALVGASVVATPKPAEARGGRIAAGVIGGLAAGAIIGSAVGPRYYGYGPAYYSYGYGPDYVEEPVCSIRRERFWDGYGWRIRRVQVCD